MADKQPGCSPCPSGRPRQSCSDPSASHRPWPNLHVGDQGRPFAPTLLTHLKAIKGARSGPGRFHQIRVTAARVPCQAAATAGTPQPRAHCMRHALAECLA
ncbi:hypothetical protein GCM10010271_55650 [Streptomyces kurssanovii]|nr:hypothetical protein GCM10010271_55650 [Streptomyces kurssanovii]